MNNHLHLTLYNIIYRAIIVGLVTAGDFLLSAAECDNQWYLHYRAGTESAHYTELIMPNGPNFLISHK